MISQVSARTLSVHVVALRYKLNSLSQDEKKKFLVTNSLLVLTRIQIRLGKIMFFETMHRFDHSFLTATELE